MDISVSTGYLYFSIEESGTIHRINLKNHTKHYINNVGQPQKLAVDWISQNVYFVNADSVYKSISLCNFDLKRCAKIIDLESHGAVSALAVDAFNKYLFYAVVNWWVFNAPNYILYKANLDGTKKTELVKLSPGHISGLAFDCNKHVLYYMDRYHGHIHMINYDASKHMYIPSNLTNPRELNLFEDHLYFLTSNGHMGRCSLYGEERTCHTFKMQDYYSHLFVISQQSRQPSTANVCNHSNCSYICVPSDVEARCICEDGALVKENEECKHHEVSFRSCFWRVIDDSIMQRSAELESRKPTFGGHYSSGVNVKAMNQGYAKTLAVAILIPLCLVLTAFTAYYVVKKRRSGKFDVR